MKEINERIALIRSELGLSMDKFGSKIGITRNSINAIEKGVNNPSTQTLKLICNEFNVDPFWLETGVGDMFTSIPETVIDEVVDEYKLDEFDKIIIKAYVQAPSDQQKAIKDFLLTIMDDLKKKSGN